MLTYYVPSNIKHLKAQHFQSNAFKSYDTIIVPGNVERIEAAVFSNCVNLKTLIIEGSPKDNAINLCGNWAVGCVASNFVIKGRSILGNHLMEIANENKNLETFCIDNPNITFKGTCFCNCPNLTTITFKKDPVRIGNDVFMHLPKLTEISLPNISNVIHKNAFYTKSNWKNNLVISTCYGDIYMRDMHVNDMNYNSNLDVDDFYSLNGKRKERYRDEDYDQNPPDDIDCSFESYGMSIYTKEELEKIDAQYSKYATSRRLP